MISWKIRVYHQMALKKMRATTVNQMALQWQDQLLFKSTNLTMKETELLKKLSIKKAKKK